MKKQRNKKSRTFHLYFFATHFSLPYGVTKDLPAKEQNNDND